MGTNYYWYEKPPCCECGREFDRLHIGKSSAGWCFSLHVMPEREINELTDWRKLWEIPGSVIRDEYEEVVSVEDMLKVITERSWQSKDPYPYPQHYLKANYAVSGPNGLLRHTYDAKPGKGTYDLVRGEFS